MKQKLSFQTHVLQDFIGKKVEVCAALSPHDGLRGVVKYLVINNDNIGCVIETQTWKQKLFRQQGQLNNVDIDLLSFVDSKHAIETFSEAVVNIEGGTEAPDQEYMDFYGNQCPCNACTHNDTFDTLGEQCKCISCPVAEECTDVNQSCAECRYHGLTLGETGDYK